MIPNRRNLQTRKKEYDLQQKIDLEIRMQEGTTKLLAACKHKIQYLEAAKSLLTSNERITTYLAEIQKQKTSEKSVKCSSKVQQHSKAKVAISDIRVPLIWKDSDHFKNRGDCRRFAVFCLIKIGTEIYDTALISDVDRNVTDVTFDDVIVFNNVSPDFELDLELYSHILDNDFSIASVPCKLKRKFSNSISRTLGKKMAATLKDEYKSPEIYPKFDLIAQTTLRLVDARASIHTHDLLVENLRNNHHGLPLFGHFCCRLAVQPECSRAVVSGDITLIEPKDDDSERRMWCVLRNFKLFFWRKSEDYLKSHPVFFISIGKNMLLELHSRQSLSFSIEDTSLSQRYIFVVDSESDYVKWTSYLIKLIEDYKQWGEIIMDSLMDIPLQLPLRLSSLFNEKRGSLYEAITINDLPISRNYKIALYDDDAYKLSPQSFRFRSYSLSTSIPNRNYQYSIMNIRKLSVNSILH